MDGTTEGGRFRAWGGRALICASTLCAAALVQGQETPVRVGGYSTWSYGKTDGNAYSVGDEQGSYEHGQLALALGAAVSDKLHVYAQPFFGASEGELEVQIDYALAEWAFSDAFKLRAGRIKMPFGIYTEIYDVGTLRPFDILPQGLYGGGGFVSEGVTGLGIGGRRSGRWSVEYDAYVGEIDTIDDGLRLDPTGQEAERERGALRDSIGGRVLLSAPVRGLSLGVSAYSGRTTEDDATRRSGLGLQAQYEDGPWAARAEYARQFFSEEGREPVQACYVELARRLGPAWQLAGRYDWFRDDAGKQLEHADLGKHEDLGFSVNYWFVDQFVVRAGYHRVTGNRFARAEEDAAEDSAARRTNLLTLNVAFAF